MSKVRVDIRRRRRFVALVLVALGLGSLAVPGVRAQIAPGQSGTSSSSGATVGNEETWQTLRVFGVCFARLNSAQAFILLATEPGTRIEAETFRQIFRGAPQDCLGYTRRMRAPTSFMRGAIAEGLFKRNIPVPADLVRAAPAPGVEIRFLSEAARCYAAGHRDQVRAMLGTPLASRREAQAIGAIMTGGLSQCLPERARSLSINPTQLRYVLAEALLRLPASSPVPAGQR